jgi:glycosyltransferase involved in cell wall biosynthesis
MPVFNERDAIEEIVGRVLASPWVEELVVVDDGSTDGTRPILEELARRARLHLFFQPKDQGKGAAVRRGIAEARAQIVVIQDADLEYDPEDFGRLVEPILAGEADVVYGSRFLEGRTGSCSSGTTWPTRC